MVRRVGHRGAYCFVGGGARNLALVGALEDTLNHPIHVPADPQTVVAIGAAVGAQARARRTAEKEAEWL